MTMTDTEDVGKLFVGGLSWETSKETLESYFSQFGEIVDCVVMKNNETGRSRGFGFITYKDPNCVNLVLQSKPHELNGRTIDAKECTPRGAQRNKKGVSQGKVFLGGLPPDITETDIRNALSKFGRVNHVTIMCDQETKKCRGFGFLSFDSEDSIDQACTQRFVNINGKQIECKRAEPRTNPRNSGQQYGMGNQNGSARGSPYGNAPGYQAGWNQPSQPYGMQGQGYGSYQNYGAAGGNSYGTNAVPYNSMPPQATQYAQPAYPSYGSMGYAYSQTPAVNYSQQAYSPPAAQGTGYSQSAAPDAKAMNMPGSYGGGYNNQTNTAVAAVGRGQGYHPYRR